MAIEFIQEDGTGKTDATSYASIAQYKQYWENRGTDYSAVADDTIKAYLNLATDYIDNTYIFKSEKTNEDQALEWPRYNVVKDKHGNLYEDDEIPIDLINATCYLAANSTELYQTGSGVSQESYGPVSKTYSNASGQTNFPVANKYLKNLIISGTTLERVN